MCIDRRRDEVSKRNTQAAKAVRREQRQAAGPVPIVTHEPEVGLHPRLTRIEGRGGVPAGELARPGHHRRTH